MIRYVKEGWQQEPNDDGLWKPGLDWSLVSGNGTSKTRQ